MSSDAAIDTKSFIEQEFKRHGIFFRTLKHDFALNCPYHQHSERQQKLEVHFDGTKVKCWVCGRKQGGYNALAETLGLKKLPRSSEFAFENVEREVAALQTMTANPSLPAGTEPFVEDYRGLDPKFLARFESRRWFDPSSKTWRILWPVRYNEKLLGYVAGRLDDQTLPKYRNGPVGSFQSRRALWPVDDQSIGNVCILVEGPYSALRVLRYGLPAVAILGTGAWHAHKLTMLQQRAIPVKGLIIAMDGDDAGWACTQQIYGAAQGRFEIVEPFECPVDKDPGDMSERFMQKLKAVHDQMVESLNS